MEKRDELFQTFGPLLLEAGYRIILDELNVLRAQHGLPARTELQFYEQVTNHYSGLEPYEWMGT